MQRDLCLAVHHDCNRMMMMMYVSRNLTHRKIHTVSDYTRGLHSYPHPSTHPPNASNTLWFLQVSMCGDNRLPLGDMTAPLPPIPLEIHLKKYAFLVTFAKSILNAGLKNFK